MIIDFKKSLSYKTTALEETCQEILNGRKVDKRDLLALSYELLKKFNLDLPANDSSIDNFFKKLRKHTSDSEKQLDFIFNYAYVFKLKEELREATNSFLNKDVNKLFSHFDVYVKTDFSIFDKIKKELSEEELKEFKNGYIWSLLEKEVKNYFSNEENIENVFETLCKPKSKVFQYEIKENKEKNKLDFNLNFGNTPFPDLYEFKKEIANLLLNENKVPDFTNHIIENVLERLRNKQDLKNDLSSGIKEKLEFKTDKISKTNYTLK